MSFEYEWTRDNLKEELIKKRYKTNTIFLIMGILLYIFFIYDALKSKLFDKLIITIIGVFFIITIMLLMFIFTRIYVAICLKKNDKDTNKAYGTYKVSLDDETVKVSINDDVIAYKYKDIVKFKKSKHQFFICTADDKLGLLFKESVVGKDNYQKLLSKISDKVIC